MMFCESFLLFLFFPVFVFWVGDLYCPTYFWKNFDSSVKPLVLLSLNCSSASSVKAYAMLSMDSSEDFVYPCSFISQPVIF